MRQPHPDFAVGIRHNGIGLDLLAGRDFILCPLGIAPSLVPDRLPPLLEDLVRLAAAVHVADTACRRGRRNGGSGWSRRIELCVEVSEPAFWNGPAVQTTLKQCLDFLGGDDWHVRFTPESRPRPRDVQKILEFVTRPTVCLFSDGLDSAAGLAARLADEPNENFLAVSVRHRSGLGGRTQDHVRRLRAHFGRDEWTLSHAVIGTLIWQKNLQSLGIDTPERSHRCRAFLFAALAGVVAEMTKASRIEVYESGVGAVNLPLRKAMTGSMATRGSHPHFLHLMGELLGHVVGRRIEYDLPFLDRTKGEMARVLAGDERLRELACSTASCVHYPLGRKVEKQCGVCPGCIFRRQALIVAGIVEPPKTYLYDLFGDPELADRVPVRHRRDLGAFLQQVARLAPLDRPGGVARRLQDHLIDTEVVGRGQEADLIQYDTLFRRHRGEWLNLAASCRQGGLWWAGTLQPRAMAN